MVYLAGFGDLLRNLLKDVEGGAKRVGETVGEHVSGVGQALRKDVGDIGSTIQRDFSSLGDSLRSHKLAIGLGAGAGLAGLGAYEYLKSQVGNNYNSQLGAGGYSGLGYSGTGGGGQGPGGGQCDPTCGQIPELPPCPQCGAGQGPGTAGGAGLGGAVSIFSDPLVWLIIAVVLIIIIVGIIMYYHKKKKKGG